MALALSPDGRSVSHSPEVIAADTPIFKVRLEDSLPTSPAQPKVYRGVTGAMYGSLVQVPMKHPLAL